MKQTADKKPDRETESLRMWRSTKEREKEITKDSFKIMTKDGIDINMVGFSTMRNKKTKELFFAWKMKNEGKLVLYYMPKKNKKADEFIRKMKNDLPFFEYQNFDDIIDNMIFEVKIMNKEKKNEN